MSNPLRAAIAGVGAYVPAKVISNDDLSKMVDTTDDWIVQRTGIKERRMAAPDESTASMATQAAKAACANAKLDPADLDMIIVATISPETLTPATACYVQRDLGAVNAAVFDISAACSGFVYALTIGRRMIESGGVRNCLVIGAETLTRYTDYTDRGSCIIFGDGAGAAVLLPSSDPKVGVQYSVLKADGRGWDYIITPAGGAKLPASSETVANRMHYLKLRGREVYKFAVERMQWLLEDCMKACSLTAAEVDLVVPHQVNIRIIESATQRLAFPTEKVFVNIQKYGNTSAASIPIALDEAIKAGKIKPGSKVILVAFGAGLTWAGAVVNF
jgi:3-oxoacyl-[acyl-carrier-protein] synthase III